MEVDSDIVVDDDDDDIVGLVDIVAAVVDVVVVDRSRTTVHMKVFVDSHRHHLA